MSRIAKAPVTVPSGVDINVNGQDVTVKGPKGSLSHTLHREVEMTREDAELRFAPRSGSKPAMAQAGTARALINNLVLGVSTGFERRLQLVGVGLRTLLDARGHSREPPGKPNTPARLPRFG